MRSCFEGDRPSELGSLPSVWQLARKALHGLQPTHVKCHVPYLPFLPTRLCGPLSRLCVSPSTFCPLSSSMSFACKTLFLQEAFSGYPGLPRAFPLLGSRSSVPFDGRSVIHSLSSCQAPALCRVLGYGDKWPQGAHSLGK